MLKEYLSTIANAIRAKTGTTEKIKAEDFADRITNIPSGSEEDFIDAFWEEYQEGGKRVDYAGAFSGYVWDANRFKPKYPIVPTKANHIFNFAKKITNLKEMIEKIQEKNKDFVFDTSKATVMNGMFQSMDFLTHVPTISTVSCAAPADNPLSTLFSWNTQLIEIEKVIFKPDGSQVLSGCFEGLNALRKITIEGKIGSSVNMKNSANLETASIVSIVEALYEGASGKTLTLSKTAVNNMQFGENGYTSPQSGITYNSWDELANTKPNWTISIL